MHTARTVTGRFVAKRVQSPVRRVTMAGENALQHGASGGVRGETGENAVHKAYGATGR